MYDDSEKATYKIQNGTQKSQGDSDPTSTCTDAPSAAPQFRNK